MEATNEMRMICQDFLERYKKALKDNGNIASGQLENTASYKISFNGNYIEIIFQLEDYWKYIENGTRPHFPPINAIENWIRVKRIVPKAVDNKVPSTRQLAYLISRKISEVGTKPTKSLKQTIDNSDDLIDLLLDEIVKQLYSEIKEELKNIKQ